MSPKTLAAGCWPCWKAVGLLSMVARLHLFWDFGDGNSGKNTQQEEDTHLMARREEGTGVLCSLQGHTPKKLIPLYSAPKL